MILGTTLYEIFMIYLKSDFYTSYSVALFLQSLFFCLIPLIDSFVIRMLLLGFIMGVNGFYGPLNSIVKSKILIEKYRATLMSIFRVPLNFYVIIVLLGLKYMDPFDVL
jgi:hypothetical protein